ncbi:calcium-activated potassium channel subunit alpha-1-like [Paramacrobiotus metropolitanus]|uniref:calcium-activated potassium channel subunit alpha-1-like n=1 Tax=Paramacrobiotus metropolitanus TaxID=2943436 RepID=UPI0024462DD7|nr:calcium-activated potassium channel subunit alpha-1-like [Paramacrobiotus metropolitanus]
MAIDGEKLANYHAPCVVLGLDRLWYIFLLSSVITPFVLSILVLIVRVLVWINAYRKHLSTYPENPITFKRWFQQYENEVQVPLFNVIRDAADNLVSMRYRLGQTLTILAFCLSMASLFIYYNLVSYYMNDVEQCQPWVYNIPQQVDFAFNCFFLVYFILRFLAAQDKMSAIWNLYSIVDYFTVPPAFVGLALDRDWIGLKFLRVVYLRKIATILASLDLITSTVKIKLLQLALTWLLVLLAAGGFFHLLENSGDPWTDDYDGQRFNYWNFAYFAFGTMATIGSPDINVKTVLGKLSNVLLVLTVLAVIGIALPDIVDLMETPRKYNGDHRNKLNQRHIVVCGDVTFASIVSLFDELFHPDRNVRNLKIVCLGVAEPDLHYAQFLKTNSLNISYFQGSYLVAHDLYRVRLHEADAAIVMANKANANADIEDNNNIMCVVSLKNFNPQLRIIVQLLQYRSKTYLTSIPNWNPHIGDDIICLPEIKLGLFAQSCAAPGFTTLMANLFASRSNDVEMDWPDWLKSYTQGTGIEMYTERISDAFTNQTYIDILETCYVKLNLILFAITEQQNADDESLFSHALILNPALNYVVKRGSYGCFFADSAKDVQRMSIYCRQCHDDITEPEAIKMCNCSTSENRRFNRSGSNGSVRPMTPKPTPHSPSILDRMVSLAGNSLHSTRSDAFLLENTSSTGYGTGPGTVNNGFDADDDPDSALTRLGDRPVTFTSFQKKMVYFMRYYGSPANWNRSSLAEPIRDDAGNILDLSGGPRYDSTGLFWWCPPKVYEEVLVDRYEAAKMNFKNHVVLVIFANDSSSGIGLNNFVMPLRSSITAYEDLKDIVILGDPQFLSMEWPSVCNFPKITMVKIFGLSRADLRAVNIHTCKLCALLTATSDNGVDSVLLADKDAILTSLTIKAMNFGNQENNFFSDSVPVTRSWRNSASVNLRNANPMLQKQSLTESIPVDNEIVRTSVVKGYAIPLLTELVNDSNVNFVEQDDFDINEFFMAEPFACGNAFAQSVLQALLVSSYFNPFTLSVLRALIFGGITPEFEQILAEGAGLIGGPNLSQKHPHPERCRLIQIDIGDVRFARHSRSTFGQLFLDAIRRYNILCFGLYRKIQQQGKESRSLRRYVITTPPKDFLLQSDDKVFVIERLSYIPSW